MRSTDHLSIDELRELLSRPLSKEATEQLLEVRRRDRGLLVFNLSEMEREEGESPLDSETGE